MSKWSQPCVEVLVEAMMMDDGEDRDGEISHWEAVLEAEKLLVPVPLAPCLMNV